MTREFVRFLKEERITETQQINSLFVSAFVHRNNWDCGHCEFISSYILSPDTPLLVKSLQYLERSGCSFQLEELIALFEFVLSPSDKIISGAVYTPKKVRDTIIGDCLRDKDNDSLNRIRIADISCGCGGFLMDAASLIHRRTGKPYSAIFRDNIFGIDIQEYAIERTKILLCLLALSEGNAEDFDFNLLCHDTLDYSNENWDANYNNFDIVIGNPPYVCSRNLPDATKVKLKKYDVCASGNPDLYIPFFKIAIDMLNDGGRLGYITMNTFLRSVNGRALREFFAQSRYTIRIVDFRGHQVFDSKNTYTCLFYLDKTPEAQGILYSVDEMGAFPTEPEYALVSYDHLNNEKGWSLNDFDNAEAIESFGIQIKDYCPSRHGIATLSNDTYIFRPTGEDDYLYFFEKKGIRVPIEKKICRDVINPNRLNSVDSLDGNFEKLIFPYKIHDNHAVLISPDKMQKDYPHAMAYLQSRKNDLLTRDKGKTESYSQWYAYGRTQSLVLPRYKLFYPKFANKALRCVIVDDPNLMLYNGLAFVNTNPRKLEILKRVIESNLFWQYVVANAKPYASGYYSLSGVDIKHFGIPVLSASEENELLSLRSRNEVEAWLRERYNSSSPL